MSKKWEYYEADTEKIRQLVQEFRIPELVARVLVNRNIIDTESVKLFLNPTRKDFHDPFLLKDMEKATNRIRKAINENEKTIIFGDYDVDGITSVSVLKKYLAERGLNVDYYIPDRLNEGYGLSKDSIQKIANEGYKLMITVDCGISRYRRSRIC